MFYDFEFYTATLEEVRNEIGEVEKAFTKSEYFIGDMQPIDEVSKVKTWGNDIQATISIYTDKALNIGDYVYSGEHLFEIEKKVDWINYKIYALRESKVL